MDRELTEEEQSAVETILDDLNESARFVGWISKSKRDKVDERILIVGRFRILTCKKSWGSVSVRRSGHLFDLKEIRSPEPDQVCITFADFFVDASSMRVDDIVLAIRTSFELISYNRPESLRPFIAVPPERQLALPQFDPVLDGGFALTYEAMAAFYEQDASPELLRHVQQTVARGERVLDLSDCPGIEPKTEYTFDLHPMVEALRYNNYFTGITIDNVGRKEAVLEIADALRYNTTLQSITLRGCSASDGFVALGLNMLENKDHSVIDLDLSQNNIQTKGVKDGLAPGLSSMTHGLRSLRVESCNIPSAGIAALMLALENNSVMSQPLETLCLSNNKIGKDGSECVFRWLSSLRFAEDAQLRTLELSGCNLDVVAVAGAIRTGCSRLTSLDLSNNRIDRAGAQSLAIVMATTLTLTDLNISSAKMSGESVEAVMSAMLHNDALNTAQVNASNNALSSSGSANVAAAVRDSNSVTSLILRSNGFKASGVVKIVDALVLNSTLTRLCLDSNVQKASNAADACSSLAKLVSTHPTLQVLQIRGSDKYYLGSHLNKVFDVMKENTTLKALDISENRIGDSGASGLAEMLLSNTALVVLSMDANNITLPGWLVLKTAFPQNTTLIEMSYPVVDEMRASSSLGSSKDGLRLKAKLRSAIDDVMTAVKLNQAASGVGVVTFDDFVLTATGDFGSPYDPYATGNGLEPTTSFNGGNSGGPAGDGGAGPSQAAYNTPAPQPQASEVGPADVSAAMDDLYGSMSPVSSGVFDQYAPVDGGSGGGGPAAPAAGSANNNNPFHQPANPSPLSQNGYDAAPPPAYTPDPPAGGTGDYQQQHAPPQQQGVDDAAAAQHAAEMDYQQQHAPPQQQGVDDAAAAQHAAEMAEYERAQAEYEREQARYEREQAEYEAQMAIYEAEQAALAEHNASVGGDADANGGGGGGDDMLPPPPLATGEGGDYDSTAVVYDNSEYGSVQPPDDPYAAEYGDDLGGGAGGSGGGGGGGGVDDPYAAEYGDDPYAADYGATDDPYAAEYGEDTAAAGGGGGVAELPPLTAPPVAVYSDSSDDDEGAAQPDAGAAAAEEDVYAIEPPPPLDI